MPIGSATHFSTRKRLIATAISACFASAPAWSNPTAPQVVSGSASFSQQGNLLAVSNSSGAIINWNTFSIGANETTRFNQASAASSVLNRVIANDPSVLLGTLSSNGRVWLVNPAGILVGQGAKIDVAGFVASTLNVRNEDFLAGRLTFGDTPNAGGIKNYGRITTPSGGSVYLVAPEVENHGIINAPNGEVMLAAGQTVELVDTGTPGVKVDITGAAGNATNLGEILVEAGRIGMAGVLVKNSGTLNASSVVREGGRIFLRASQRIEIDEAGRMVADGTKGGEVIAKTEKDGKIAGELVAHGAISAQGDGSKGSGGFVETSAAKVDLNGASVATRGGKWLIDPNDFTIAASGGDMTGATLASNLGSGDVTIETATQGSPDGNGDIFVNDAIAKTGGVDSTLTLKAERSVGIAQPISSSASKLNVTLNAHATSDTASGNVAISADISTHGGNVIIGGGLDPATTPAIGYGDGASEQRNGVTVYGASIMTGGGSIAMRGQGYGSGSYNNGIALIAGASLTSAGGSIDLYGRGGGGGNYNYGIYAKNATLDSSVAGARGGTITLDGRGGNGSSSYYSDNRGVFLDSGTSVTTGGGALSITGAGGDGGEGYGISMVDASLDSSLEGDIGGAITLNGTGGGTGDDNYGVYLVSANIVSGGGDVTLKGYGGSGASWNVGVYLYGNDTGEGSDMWIETGGGKLSIYGEGKGAGSSNYGVNVHSSHLDTGGSSGGGVGGTLTIEGYGSSGASENSGVYLTSSELLTDGGNLSVTGVGGGVGDENYGIYADATDMDSSYAGGGGGDLTLTGTGATGAESNVGIKLDGSSVGHTTITTGSGALQLTGTGAGSGIDNYGIHTVYATLDSGDGPTALTGVGATGAAGIYFENGTTLGNESASASITLTADRIRVGNTSNNTIWGSKLTLEPYNAATTIGIDGGAGTLQLDDVLAIAPNTHFSEYVIGKSDGTGRVTVGHTSDLTDIDVGDANLTLRNPGAGSEGMDFVTDINAGNLTLDTTGVVTQYESGVAATGIHVSNLNLLGAGAYYLLNSSGNTIASLTGGTGGVSLNNGSAALDIGSAKLTVSDFAVITAGSVTNQANIQGGVLQIVNGTANYVGPNVKYWVGSSSGGAWNAGTNWSGGVVPGSNSLVRIVTTNISAPRITLDATAAPASLVSAADFQIDAGGVLSSGGDARFLRNLTMYGGTLSIGSGTTATMDTLTLNSGSIAGAGSLAVTRDFDFTGSGSLAMLGGGFYDVSLTRQGSINVGTPLSAAHKLTLYAQGEESDLTLSANLSKTGAADGIFTLKADHAIVLESGSNIGLDDGASGKLDVILNANAAGNGAGNILLHADSGIATNGGNLVMGGGACSILTWDCNDAAIGWLDEAGGREGIFLGDPNSSVSLVNLDTSTASGTGGTIWMKGQGLTDGSPNGSFAHGIYTQYSSLSSGGGKVMMTGLGGSSTDSDNHGVHLDQGTSILTSGGAIELTGTGGGSEDRNYGVYTAGAVLDTRRDGGTGGAITLNGRGGSGYQGNYGVYLDWDSVEQGTEIHTGGGTLSITGYGGGDGYQNYGVATYTNTVLDTGGGDAIIEGRGGNSSDSAGVHLYLDTHISTGGGKLNITGISGDGGEGSGIYVYSSTLDTSGGTLGGDVTLNGWGGNGYGENIGVYLDHDTSITTGGGKLTITGMGGGDGYDNYGIHIYAAGLDTSRDNGIGGAVTLKGTGSASGSSWNIGVFLDGNTSYGGTRISTGGGTLEITGTGGGWGDENHGITTYFTALDSGAGTTTLTGIGAAGAASMRFDSSTIIGGSSGAPQSGNITLVVGTANGSGSIALENNDTEGDAPRIQGTGSLSLRPLDISASIGLAGGTGDLSLDSAFLDAIQPGFSGVVIGNAAGTGGISVGEYAGSTSNVLGSSNLALQNGGSGSAGVQFDGALSVGGSITVVSGGNIRLGSEASLSSAASGDAITLASTDGTVTNASGVGSPLSTPNGRWLIWASDPNKVDLGSSGLAEAFRQYNATYGSTAVQTTTGGNGLLFSDAGTMTGTISGTTSKVYDGSAAASGLAFNGSNAYGDSISTSFSYFDKNVGSAKAIDPGTFTSGAFHNGIPVYDTGFSLPNGGAITPRSLTVTATGANKVYDGLTGASVSYGDNRVAGDVLSIGGSASFADKNVGTGKTVSVSGITVSGADSGNYSYNASATTSADITKRSLSISANGVNKVYDGLTSASVSFGDDRVAGDVLSISGSASFADKNVGTGKSVSVGSISLSGTDAGNYSYNSTASTLADITKRALNLSASGVNKVYDGQTSATVNYGDDRVAGDVLSISGSANFADRNVGTGKTVSVSGIALSGTDAGNYSYATTATTSADITVRPQSNWVGGASGNWSAAANWDALPDGSNVLAATVPNTTTVTYDTSAGTTNLTSLTAGGLSISGGSLNIANNLTVNTSFGLSGGTLTFGDGATADITQASGDLNVPAMQLATLSLNAPAGAISQSGAIVVTTLSTQSATGTTLNNAGNRITNFSATNSGNGDIALTNVGALTINGISNSGGAVIVDNTGAVVTAGLVAALNNAVSIVAHSPLTIGAGGVSAGGNITLTAGDVLGAGDDLTLSGPIAANAAGATIALSAGDNLLQNANVTANGGAISAIAQNGDISMALGASTVSNGGSIGYAAQNGNISLTSLDAGANGTINLAAGGSIGAVPGFTGPNLIAGSAVIAASGNANLTTKVSKLDVTVGGLFTFVDSTSGSVVSNVPGQKTESEATKPVVEQVVSTIVATTQTKSTTTEPTPTTSVDLNALPATGAGGTASEGTGGESGTFGASDSGKSDEQKEEEKDKEKKNGEADAKKEEEKPAGKKLKTCG